MYCILKYLIAVAGETLFCLLMSLIEAIPLKSEIILAINLFVLR